jgi:hypothetical protein
VQSRLDAYAYRSTHFHLFRGLAEGWLYHAPRKVRRSDGSETDIYLLIMNIPGGEQCIPADRGEKSETFTARAAELAIDYLNGLGSVGWEVIHLTASGPPFGSYLLKRQIRMTAASTMWLAQETRRKPNGGAMPGGAGGNP